MSEIKAFDPCRMAIADLISRSVEKWGIIFSAQDAFKSLERPPENIEGDFAFPCFRFARDRRLPPPKIAAELAEQLKSEGSPWIAEVSTAAAFCNISINLNYMATEQFPRILDRSFFLIENNNPKKVMVEFSQPNTHKDFHVGHARNFCLGDSLVRILRCIGHEVTAANYPGDEGTHIAKCLWYITKFKKDAPECDRGAWLGEMYTAATMHLDALSKEEREAANAEVSQVLAAIESKDGELFEKWKETREWSLQLFRQVYKRMDVHFDQYFFESEVSEESQNIVDKYLESGVFKEDDGAVGLDLSDDKLGFMLVRKRDGNTLYATKDLALAERKFSQFKIDQSIYVVASEQNLHFRQVFKTLEKMGFAQAKDCFHLSYGMVTLPEGKMSSRKGNAISFSELDQALETELGQSLKKYEGNWSDSEIKECLRRLAVGSIRYGMLSTDPVKDVVFNMSDWMSFEGNSGPYLMYSYARTRSILQKAKEAGVGFSESFTTLSGPECRELMQGIHDFNSTVLAASEQYKPSLICHHLYNLCRSFNRFYAHQSVLKAPDEKTKSERLTLVECFARVLHTGLQLLGITPPERM